MAMLQAQTESGPVLGMPGRDQKTTVFRGIPYARAQRWRAPVAVEPWDEPRACFTFGAICPQQKFGFEGDLSLAATEFYVVDYPQSEDCLVVNVWTPAREPGERLPVAVYVHGGGYETGYGWLNAYDGEGFCRRGVILVTINYRLNVFGYLAHPDLAAEDPHGSTGAYGVLDQVAALGWVRRNIAAFGGDPDHIMVFGQSAGGMSVENLLLSPLTRGVISAAIMQSGGGLQRGGGSTGVLTRDVAYERAEGFLRVCGASSIAELRALPAETLVARTIEYGKQVRMPFTPAIDGYAIILPPAEYFRRGLHDDIDIVVGCTADEMRNRAAAPMGQAALERFALDRFGDRADAYLAAVGPAADIDPDDLNDPVGNEFYAAGLAFAENQLRIGFRPVHLYHIDYVPPTAGSAHHSVEHHYVFETLNGSPRPYTAADYDLALTLAGYWANVATTGDPNGRKYPTGNDERLPTWEPYRADDRRALIIGNPPAMGELPISRHVAFLRDFNLDG